MALLGSLLPPVVSLTVLGVFFGALLGIASRIFAVEADLRVDQIVSCLPGGNCGGCGYPGCSAFAEAVAAGRAPTNGCVVGGNPVACEVARIMGTEALAVQRRALPPQLARSVSSSRMSSAVRWAISVQALPSPTPRPSATLSQFSGGTASWTKRRPASHVTSNWGRAEPSRTLPSRAIRPLRGSRLWWSAITSARRRRQRRKRASSAGTVSC